MTDFSRQFRRFVARLGLRRASYWALWGLAAVLATVAAAPWLGVDWTVLMALCVSVPCIAAAAALAGKPARRDAALAADHWSGGQGSIVAAVEIAPENPFRAYVEAQALQSLRAGRVPAPRTLRYLFSTIAVLACLMPLSRYAYAAWGEGTQKARSADSTGKPGIDPDQAADLARHAGTLAENAKKLGATGQEQLADAIEDAAKRAQAGADNKENALRNANALADKAREQTRGQEERDKAREAMKQSDAAKALAKASEQLDPAKLDAAAKETADKMFADGKVNAAAANELCEALKKAAEAAPHDATLKQAAADALKELSPEKLAAMEKLLEEKKSELKAAGASDDVASKELKKLQDEQAKELARSLGEMAKAASLMRDLDPDGKLAAEMMKELMKGGASMEQLKQMAEQAQEMSKQLEFDAETLREMIKQGKQFPGLEEHARQMMEKSLKEGKPIDPGAIPEWGNAAKEALRDKAGPVASGKKPVAGSDTGVDVNPRTDGPKDPDKDPAKLDPTKAGSETSKLNATGGKATGGTVETAEEVDRLPRRYRDAARKYFGR
ncbi:MAG: hypothetical protein IT462_03040 [Planctomycetes bacterium]|nr:hypothetical protein [Planctomycetota bacterium]